MRRAFALLALVFSACGPDVSSWVGTYAGSGSLNAGRAPEAVVGTLTVTADARFTLTSNATGSSNSVFTCSLVASTVDSTKASFTVPTTCELGVSPSDGCSYQLTINAAQVNRADTAVDGTVSGRVNATCSGAGNSVNDFLLSFGGTRR